MTENNDSMVSELKKLGDDLLKEKKYEEAVEKYKTALSLNSTKEDWVLGGLYIKLANAYYELKDLDNYIKYYELYLELYPDGQVAVFSRLAHAYYFIDTNKSIEYHNKGLNASINDYDATCKMFAMIKSSNYTQEEIKNEAEYEMKRLQSALFSDMKHFYTPENKKVKKDGEKLNIGYLSSDCHTHIMMNYILPVWENHNKEKFNITIFNCSKTVDATTAKIENTGHNIIKCSEMSNDELAKTIFNNDIDILVDLSGFTHLRSVVHFQKPAPVAVSYLGYLNTMGMKEVDYILADRNTIPENAAGLYTEKPLYLDSQFEVFAPAANLPDLSECPFENNGYITFGSFNCTSKFSSAILYLWSKILQEVPNSKLLIYRTQMTKSSIIRLQRIFEELGVDGKRIEYKTSSYSPHLRAYLQADISLDTWPFSGMSICSENALMGVPTITMKGEGLQSNGAGTVNRACGLEDLTAASGEDYVKIAARLANDKDRLKYLRQNLRNIMINSPLCTNYKGFTQDLEDKYEKIWAEYSQAKQ